MKNQMRRRLSLALATVMICGLLAGCGGGGGGSDPDPAANSGLTPEEELQAALQREEDAAKKAEQEELAKQEGNTKPGTESGNRPNGGDGGGMAGLGEDGEDGENNPGADIGNDETDIPGGEYGYDGTYAKPEDMPDLTLEDLGVPDWNGQPWVAINGNTPFFAVPEKRPRTGETYSSLDQMRRPGSARVVLTGATEGMKDYSVAVQAGTLSVPGWNRDSYPGVIATIDESNIAAGEVNDGELFYIRRLVGSGLSEAEQGRRNTMVMTQYMGEYGLKTLEDAVIRYTQRSGRAVIYRVTPVFMGKEEVARGAVVEAMSYGDSAADVGAGKDLCFCMFVYNVQPGVKIDYRDGSSGIDDDADPKLSTTVSAAYVLDTARRQAHRTNCYQLIRDVSPAVQSYYYGSVDDLVRWSYDWNACDCMDGEYVPPEIDFEPEVNLTDDDADLDER